jgi:hypothetical protein
MSLALLISCDMEISRTVINLAYRDIVTLQLGHWPLLTRTRYVCTCVGAGSGMGGGIRKIKAIRWGAYYYSLVLKAQPYKYDMYKSSLRHIHDPVLSSLKMKVIRFFLKENGWPLLDRKMSGKPRWWSKIWEDWKIVSFKIFLSPPLLPPSFWPILFFGRNLQVARDSLVGIATRYRTDGPGVESL